MCGNHTCSVFFNDRPAFPFFQSSSTSIERGSGVHMGLGMGISGNLIAGLGLRLGLDIVMGVGMDADGVVNVFSSCCLDIYS